MKANCKDCVACMPKKDDISCEFPNGYECALDCECYPNSAYQCIDFIDNKVIGE